MRKILALALLGSLFAVGCEFKVKPIQQPQVAPAPAPRPVPPKLVPPSPPIVVPVVPVVPGPFSADFMEGYWDAYRFRTIRPGKWAIDPEYRRGYTLGESDRNHGIIRFTRIQ